MQCRHRVVISIVSVVPERSTNVERIGARAKRENMFNREAGCLIFTFGVLGINLSKSLNVVLDDW